MSSTKPYLSHISTSNDLITSHEATRSGFLEMALERNNKANPIINQAKILRTAVSQVKQPYDLLNIITIKDALLTSAGFSEKAKKYVNPDEMDEVISKFIDAFLIPAGSQFIDELTYRFLLTKGDSIGGSLRNLAGKLAMKKISASIIAALTIYKMKYYIQTRKNKIWIDGSSFEGLEESIIGISWKKEKRNRTLIYNYKIPSVGNNIDACLVNCSFENIEEVILRSPESFIALGEVKGGIDPAGADEHWKTARTALTRIRQSFSNIEKFPRTFFIGAAIERNMAQEIWNQLETNVLTNAANLTNTDHLSSIINWLIAL